MKNRKMRFVCLTAALLLGTGLLTGCSGGSSEDGGSSALSDTQQEEQEQEAVRNYSVSDAEEKILILYIQTGSADMPVVDITCSETTTAQTLAFRTYETGAGYMYCVAEVPDGTWRVTVGADGYDTDYYDVEVTEDINVYYCPFEFGDYEDDEDDEEETDVSKSGVEVSSKSIIIGIPDDALAYDGHNYKVYEIDGDITWSEAEAQCESLGGHLVTVTSEEEEDFLRDQIYQEGKNYWIGGYYSGSEWKWVTGEEADFTDWSEEPTESESESYEYMGVSGDAWQYYNESGKWTDQSVTGYICEWEQEKLEYLTSGQLIAEEDMNFLLAAAEEAFYEDVNTAWSEGVENLRGMDYLGYYFLAPSEEDIGNRLYLVYKINVELLWELSDGYLNEIVTYYLTISYDDLVIGPDGYLELDSQSPALTSHKYEISDTEYYFYYFGYETLEEAESAVLSAAGSSFRVETNVTDIETDYEPVLLSEQSGEEDAGEADEGTAEESGEVEEDPSGESEESEDADETAEAEE